MGRAADRKTSRWKCASWCRLVTLVVFCGRVGLCQVFSSQVPGFGGRILFGGASFPRLVSPQRRIADNSLFVTGRDMLGGAEVYGAMNRTAGSILNQRDRRQCLIPTSFPCNCNSFSSAYVPETVHELRPGDIDIVAALGDSISAGTGAMAENVVQVGTEYRGVSFCIGGDGDWNQYLTLPNIIKIFNPYLYGYSLGEKKISSKSDTVLNFAESGAESDDVIAQAYRLIGRLKSDPNVDWEKSWKFITILVGHNDICSYSCKRVDLFSKEEPKSASPYVYARNIAEILDILHKEVPRTFVNLMPIADVTTLLEIHDKPLPCVFTHVYGCPCLFDKTLSERLSKSEMKFLLNEYLRELETLVATGRYDTRPDFTVVIQPTLVKGQLPRTRGSRRRIDLNYLAPDCFHWAQKLHAMVARSLWNSLLEPVGDKTTNFGQDVPFLCPTEEYPYLATSLNSGPRAPNYKRSMTSDYIKMEQSSGFLPCPL